MLHRKSRLIGAMTALLLLALAASCRGFFVNPTLTALSVGPQNLQLTKTQTWQMTATGTYSDGTQKQLNSGVVWSTSDSTKVSVGQTSGVVTGVDIGSATISASSGSCSACSGSTSVTVVLQGVTSIVVGGSGQTIHPTSSTPAYLTATAEPSSIDITNNAAWTVVDSGGTDQTAHFTLSYLAGSGEGFLPDGTLVSGTYTVKATYASVVGTATLNVSNP